MSGDYRVTEYCPEFDNILTKKAGLVEMIRKKHPRRRDLHCLISPNDSEYKIPFMEVYNCKCSYCGVSIDIIPKDNFEIDHYIYKEDKEKFSTAADAGYIENLVLACRRCNHQKSSFAIEDDFLEILHPDSDCIKTVFERSESYDIVISKEYIKSPTIIAFYNQLKLGQEVHKFDYLLLKMMGQQKSAASSDKYRALGEAISLLRQRRNMI